MAVPQLSKDIDAVIAFIESHLPMINCHMVDYFIDSVYETAVDDDIKREIVQLGYTEAFNILFNNNNQTSAPNLQKFVDNAKQFYLHDFCIDRQTLNEKLIECGCTETYGTKLNIFVNPKKSHEVEVLSGLCASLNSISNSAYLVDIGDGKGYLSSVLALSYKLPVLGIEASLKKTKGAIERVEKLSRNWKEVRGCKGGLYKQVTEYVDADTDLNTLVGDAFVTRPSHLGLIGLHTCGELGPSSLKLFNNNESVRTICNISCCYHLLTEQSEGPESNWGFPLSRHLIQRKFRLGRFARMLACQSIDRILHKKELPSKTLFYRAILQVFMRNHQLNATKHVGRFRKEPENFENYAYEALKYLGFNNFANSEQLVELYVTFEKRHSELNVFYLMRCLLAPVIESVLLLDRLLFLYENGHEHAFLVKLFDPVISPRCYGIVALKPKQL